MAHPQAGQPAPPSGLYALVDRIGIPVHLFWGFVGTLIFMIGDGVESGYLSKYLVGLKFNEHSVALLFTVYGVTASISAWLSGALSDVVGPRRVMIAGLVIWVVFQLCFLAIAIPSHDFSLLLLFYALRGFGYPLFAFGFLVWIVETTAGYRLGSGVGWFWFAFTGGLPTLGTLFARFAIPAIGAYHVFWAALVLVVVGGLIALIGVRDPRGSHGMRENQGTVLQTLFSGFSVGWHHPKVGIGCIVRAINTAPEFGFLVFLPIYFTKALHFGLDQWLNVLFFTYASNIIWNLLFGVIGDHLGWRRTVMIFGGLGSAVSTMAFYYVPTVFGPAHEILAILAGAFYGATLAGYVPLSALMPSLAPEEKGSAMSLLNLGAGASVWVGPGIVFAFQGLVGVFGIMVIYAAIYVLSAALASMLTLPGGDSTQWTLDPGLDETAAAAR